MSSDFSVVAIVAAYNEADIIDHVVRDLIAQGVGVYLLDDGSTDATVPTVERYLGRGVIGIECLSEGLGARQDIFDWERILLRKGQLARELDADWFIHHDADEFRESPWSPLSLNEAIRRVDALGFNAIDFDCLHFWPVHDRFRPGDDVREAFRYYASPAAYDRVQIRCWKKTDALVDLASSGGHEARFSGRNVFPVPFLLRHYPIRGQAHGERKVFRERRARFLEREMARGWHVQYDVVPEGASFIHDPATLTPYDSDTVRVALTLRHRRVDELEASLNAIGSEVDILRHDCEARGREIGALREALSAGTLKLESGKVALDEVRATLNARHSELTALLGDFEKRGVEIDELRRGMDLRNSEIGHLRGAVADAARRVDELQRSWSWRCTSPARAVYRVLTRR